MIKKIFKKIPVVTIPLIACVVALGVFALLLNSRINAESTGSLIGEGMGTIVGKAIGSFEGLTKGQKEGYEAGKNEALSVEDIEIELSGKIKDVAKLQVLVASGTYTDMVFVGEKQDYAAILSQKYNTVFTVNLGTADISLDSGVLYVVLDQPVAEFITVGDVSVENEYKKNSFTGSADDGHTAAINAINKLKEEGMKAFDGYDSMMSAARASAEEQLINLVKAVSLSKPRVSIEWRQSDE